MSLIVGSFSDFEERARKVAGILSSIKPEDRTLIISHLDADGLSSGSIIVSALLRSGASPHLRVVKQLDAGVVNEIQQINPRYVIFTDMGSGQKSLLSQLGSTTTVIIDHHQPEKAGEDFLEMNPHLSGFDGSSELSASGAAFFVASKMDSANRDLAHLAIVGALGDIQDKGERSTLMGLNARIVEEAQTAGHVEVKKGLKLYGFESRPLVQCMAYTMDPYLPGLSGDEGACYKFLKNAGIDARKPDGSWKSLADLSKDELRSIINSVIKYLISQGVSSREAESIVGAIYVFPQEGADTPLRDVREFSSSINACGRLGKYGLGIAICMGDRSNAMAELKEVLQNYRKTISGYLKWIETNKEAVKILTNVQAVFGGSTVDEKIIGTLISIAISTKPFTNSRPIIGFADSSGVVKVSARASPDLVRRGLDLGTVMKEASEKLGGAGGGHNIAAGAQIPKGREDEFLTLADEAISRMIGGVRL